jgi:hypothetical protein
LHTVIKIEYVFGFITKLTKIGTQSYEKLIIIMLAKENPKTENKKGLKLGCGQTFGRYSD